MPYRQPSYAEQIWYILRFKLKEVLRMPYKPAHPCHWPGCGKLTHNRYCEKHTKQSNKNYEKYGRDPAVRRRYGRPWSRIRVPVEEVHHKLPLAEGGTHDRDNLISLCKSCHARIHAERGDRWHNTTKDSDENSHDSE